MIKKPKKIANHNDKDKPKASPNLPKPNKKHQKQRKTRRKITLSAPTS